MLSEMEILKICSKCNTEKSADRFGEKSRTCKDCINTQRRERYYKGRDNELAQKREKYAQNLDHYKVKNKTYHKANKEKVLLRKKLYYQQNKNKILERFNDQYKNDKDFRLKHCIRRRTREFLNDGTKLKYREMIGCDHEILVKWFEYNFEQDIHMNMNWENYNIWAIDH